MKVILRNQAHAWFNKLKSKCYLWPSRKEGYTLCYALLRNDWHAIDQKWVSVHQRQLL